MKRGMKFLVLNLVFSLFIFVFVVSLPFSSASVYPGNNSLVLTKTKYAVNESLRGRVNVSIANESGDSMFSYNSQSVSLIQVLMNSSLISGVDYFCSTQFCQDTYRTPTLSQSEITISSGYLGLLVSGTNVEINTPPSFVIKGSIDTPSCSDQTPLEIDLLDDGIIDYKYLKAGDFCSELRKSPCYRLDLSSSYDEQSVSITSNGYCQEINPPMSSRFMIYANRTKRTSVAGTGKLNLSMYYSSYDGDVIKESSCSPGEPGETYGMVNCSVNFAVSGEPGGSYYLCIKDEKQQSTENYAIMRQRKEPKCGYSEIPLFNYSSPTGNYPLFYQAAEIASFNQDEKINLSEIIKFRGDIDLIYDINSYLAESYGSDCSNYQDIEYPNCILPIKISATSQVTFSNFAISWNDDGTPISSSDYINIFSIEKKAPKVSTSQYKSIEISDAAFLVPSTYGKYNFSLFLGGIKLGDNGFEVTDVPSISRIEPLEVFAGTDTTFVSTVYSKRNIISYKWDFGDGNSQTTDKKAVLHAYSEIGEFNLSLTVMDNASISSTQIFLIKVLSPKEKIPSIIGYKLGGIKTVEGNISSLLSWQQNYIRNQINFNEIKQLLTDLNESYQDAENDSEYLAIVNSLNEIDAPLSLKILKDATNFPYLHKRDYIDVSKLSQIGLGDYSLDGEDLIKDQVFVWELGKANVKIDSKVVSLNKESGEQELATIFDLKIKGAYDNPVYILLPYSEIYSGNALSKKNGTSYSYLKLESLSDNYVSFMLPGKVNLDELIFVISPSFENLGIIVNATCNANDICEKDLGENSKNCRYDCKPYGLAVTWIILLLIIGVIAWIIIKDYYNNRYETHLFKNKHDLDNLKIFITNSRIKSTKDREIKSKLKKAGWESEQIDYAFLSLEKQKKQVSQQKSITPSVLTSKVPQSQQTQVNKQALEQPKPIFRRPFFRRFK